MCCRVSEDLILFRSIRFSRSVMCCRVLEDLILFRSIRCNQVCYLYLSLSF
jgi:hypothetical protein